MIDLDVIRARHGFLSPHLDERARRLFAASETRVAGYGRVAVVSRAMGIAASTIGRGLKELAVTAERVAQVIFQRVPGDNYRERSASISVSGRRGSGGWA